MTETIKEYKTLYDAFDFFNESLFNKKLPDVLITLNRRKGAAGYYCQDMFQARNSEKTVDEIALNPQSFISRSDTEIISTLVHEMCHTWQAHCGKPSRNGYHNREWSGIMQEVGLMPSDTGLPGGKKTGQKMTHYIINGGPFDQMCKQFLSDSKLNWQSYEPVDDEKDKSEKKKKSKIKYSCPDCGINAWGKPELNIVCGECLQPFEAVEVDD